MRKIIGLGILTLLFGCGAKKQVVLQQPKPVTTVTDTVHDKPVQKENTSAASAADEGLAPTPGISSAENIRLLMQTGLNKNVDWAEAMHYDVRKPSFVIIHHTAQNSINQTIRTFQVPHSKVSAHYVIGRDGRIVQMLNDYLRAWHAGRSKWGSITDINSVSIGIELDNNGKEPFAPAQIDALMGLLDTLKAKYQIPATNFIGHADIAPLRKDDPSTLFPWKQLADRGFGVWYDEKNLEPLPDNFNYIDALRIVGYDVNNLRGAIIAFKRKFVVVDTSAMMTDYDKRILYNVYRRYY